jgi:hypothetical protein|tara:strand:+ start:115 stop:759 length:645 start_codon:yes stop_codon:yes gene_type:complete
MRTWLEHDWGKIETQCHVSSLQRANVDPGEEDLALSLGFLSADDDKDYWYNCRSTRVRLKKNARQPKGQLVGVQTDPVPETKEIYKQWCEEKGFSMYEGDNEFIPEDTCILYYLNDELVAYSKIRIYDTSGYLLVNAGIIPNVAMETLRWEMYLLKQLGKEYCYLGQGYEKSGLWKSKKSTFEWWTGSKWSKDTTIYDQLCIRDSEIKYTGPEL